MTNHFSGRTTYNLQINSWIVKDYAKVLITLNTGCHENKQKPHTEIPILEIFSISFFGRCVVVIDSDFRVKSLELQTT